VLGNRFVTYDEIKNKSGRRFFLHKRNDDQSIKYEKEFPVSSLHTRKLTGLPFIVHEGSERRMSEQGPSARRPEGVSWSHR